LNPTILVLGGGGMLGHKIFQRLGRQFPSTFCTLHAEASAPPFGGIPMFRSERVFGNVDVLRSQRFRKLVEDLEPAFIVNCVGIVKQRAAAKDPVPSIRINALFPHELSDISARWGGRVIHFSTDCVFSGRRGHYSESDVSDAEDLYGRTKFLGELSGANVVTLRTSMIGRELTSHESLLDWFLGQNHKSVRGFTRAMYSGVTTNHLADVVATLVERNLPINGLYQVASRAISKFDLLTLIREAYRLDIEIVPDEQFVCDRTMNGGRFEAAMGYTCPSWRELTAELAGDPTPYEEWLHYETV
jgi:dTDP-4-dehydrorhamnose reductase